ncbi:hypothetical protein BGZ94_001062 [Podila epigama]|nr:hypothetical protein BGZ94_001062 [Podila epigama]
MAKAKRQPRGLGRAAAEAASGSTGNSGADNAIRHNPIARSAKETGSGKDLSKDENQDQSKDEEMTEASDVPEQETASIALQGDAGDEMTELRQTYEAAQKQFAESGTQEYLRGTIHECDRMLRNCGEDVYPSSEFNYIYASALHDFSLIGAEPEELDGFVDLALEYIGHAADLLDKTKDSEWTWKYYLVAGKVHIQKADSLYEAQENAGSEKAYKKLGKELHTELLQAKNFLDTGFSLIPEGEEKHIVRLDSKSIEKVLAKPHEMVTSAANVALHADRFEDYERRKMWNRWALETYQKVVAGWWADEADKEEEEGDDDEDEHQEEPEDEYSLPVYSTERGQMSFNALEAIKKAIELARKSDSLTSDLLSLGAECHLNLVNIAVGDKAAADQSKEAVALIKEAISTFPDAGLEERYAEVLEEFAEIAGK